MPKVRAKILAVKDENGRLLAEVVFNRKRPAVGEYVIVKWGSTRTLSQNSLYWVYLTWLIEEAGLKDLGHRDPEALHINLKNYILAEKMFDRGKFKVIEEASTAMLNKSEFGEYFDTVDMVVGELFQLDTSPFWEIYQKDWKM